MQTCYRCNRKLPAHYFEPPVTLCMTCYGGCRGNEGLNLGELRAKAKKARKGKVGLKRPDIERDLQVDSNIWQCPTCLVPVHGEPAMNDDMVFDRIKLDCGHVIIPEEDDEDVK